MAWQSEGSNRYGIRSIPSNVLIDGKGVIIAHNLKGAALGRFLESQKINCQIVFLSIFGKIFALVD